jgi:hypothetical protein
MESKTTYHSVMTGPKWGLVSIGLGSASLAVMISA